jgi:hypothetical protein
VSKLLFLHQWQPIRRSKPHTIKKAVDVQPSTIKFQRLQTNSLASYSTYNVPSHYDLMSELGTTRPSEGAEHSERTSSTAGWKRMELGFCQARNVNPFGTRLKRIEISKEGGWCPGIPMHTCSFALPTLASIGLTRRASRSQPPSSFDLRHCGRLRKPLATFVVR